MKNRNRKYKRIFIIITLIIIAGILSNHLYHDRKQRIENEKALHYLCDTYGLEKGAAKKKVILDTDMTFLGDDAFCLSILVQADNIGLIDLLGVTITGGNSFVSVGTNAALRQLELWGRPDIPVYMGTDEPLNGFRNIEEQRKIVGSIDNWGALVNYEDYVKPEDYHNLGTYYERKWGYSETKPQAERAVDFLAEQVNQNKNEITIISIGSPISIAMACQEDDSFAKNVKEIIYMGGIIGEKGSYTPYADFNCFYDAEAFRVCFESDFPSQILIPHETTETIKISKEFYDLAEQKGNTQISDFWMEYQSGLYRRDEDREDSCADALAAMVCLMPDAVSESEHQTVSINTDELKKEYGKLILNQSKEDANVLIVKEIDEKKYWDFLTDLFCHVTGKEND